jgi:hypothetical protein
MAKIVSGRRVYVTFLKDGTIAIHPSKCNQDRYRMMGKGSIHIPKGTTPKELGQKVMDIRNICLT